MSSDDRDLPTSAGGPAARGADTMVDDGPGGVTDRDLGSDASSRDVPDIDARPGETLTTMLPFPERYLQRKELGAGGMGVVSLCVDRQIGREVALKVMLEKEATKASARSRFVREARVQAQLEHPGVVPVYDLGMTPGGQPYFAMKRVRGITLQAVLTAQRQGEAEYFERFPLRKLLGVIERVCECVAYAHARGVVHRDLKPANVMLGDFGEVNVLDWGIAKLRSDTDLEDPTKNEIVEYTVPGSVIGTAGYMAPEQATGMEIDARADVYVLGAILFEVIAGSPLHMGSGADRMRSTLEGIDGRPSLRIDGPVAPELDAICHRATRMRRAERYNDAGEMLAELHVYLDGQRVTELRREVATKHAEAARMSLAGGVSATETVRAHALRELGAAAVLDPDNPEMIRMIESLLEPDSDTVPAKVKEDLEQAREKAASHAAGRSALAYAGALLVLPLFYWMGVRDWWVFGAFAGLLTLSSVGAFAMWRLRRASGLIAAISVPFAFLTLAVLSALFGPFFLVPALAAATAVAFTVSVRADWRMRGLINACGVLAVLIPVALEQLGFLPRTLEFVNGTIVITPQLVDFPEVPTLFLLLFSGLFVIVVPHALVGRAVEALRQAEKRQLLLAHRLRSMLPETRP